MDLEIGQGKLQSNHILAVEKTDKSKDPNLAKANTQKAKDWSQKPKEKRKNKPHNLHTKPLRLDGPKGSQDSDYNQGSHPKQPPTPSLLIWRLDLTLTSLNFELLA